jgi:hypothetical protein
MFDLLFIFHHFLKSVLFLQHLENKSDLLIRSHIEKRWRIHHSLDESYC